MTNEDLTAMAIRMDDDAGRLEEWALSLSRGTSKDAAVAAMYRAAFMIRSAADEIKRIRGKVSVDA